jgi:hypothetical protein
LIVKKGSKISLSFSDGIPGPESRIEATTDDAPFASVRPISARPLGIASIASMLLRIKFIITCVVEPPARALEMASNTARRFEPMPVPGGNQILRAWYC